jgi:hypothetical protein
MDAIALQKINQYRPNGCPEYTEGEVSSFDILAANNLLSHSRAKWDIESLKTMTRQYQGQPLMLDHQWDNVSTQMAFIYDSLLYHWEKPSQQIRDYYLSLSPFPDLDSDILDKEGLYQSICKVATETSHPITNELTYGRKLKASIGGYARGPLICPLCETSFYDDACPHYIPDANQSMDQDPIAPYFIYSGWYHTVELSLVTDGNCPSAQVLNFKTAKILSLA